MSAATCHPDRPVDSKGLCGACARKARRLRALTDPQLHTNGAPEGYVLRGVSTLRETPEGMQWVKTERKHEQIHELIEVIRESFDVKPIRAARPVRAPAHASADLLAVYPMGDPHFGMLSWPEETGHDFNLAIAREHLESATLQLVSLMPPAELAWILPLGDLLHSDGYNAATTKGTRVDVDSRYPKMVRAAVDTLVCCIDAALRKHARVRVTIVRGNHDDTASLTVAIALERHYRLEPRVQVDSSAQDYHWLEFGENLLGTTHGHKLKAERMKDVMAVDQRQAWGRTSHRRMYTGHVHHESVKELPGVTVETFRTLAPGDAWHHGQGYRADRGAVADVWHRTRGKILRHEIGVESL